ncbi:hypothetical protein Nepgr_003925 [Nepenthes gracilis]|uniref:Uncharacterized protein n=1 Tax=Nepenthes gracilis TaxID=150966 RepID=A0AAD3XEN2_NEPGR|nr:hypothetical protein Nepgr_003925 [Nepenthes gracilis]
MDRRRSHLLTNSDLDVLEPAASPNVDVPNHVVATLPHTSGTNPSGQVYSTDGDSRASVGGYQLAISLKSSFLSPAVGDGQEIGDDDQVQPTAEPLYDSHPLPITLKPADEVCELVSSPSVGAAASASDELKACLGQLDPASDPSVLSVDNETQPLGVASRESPGLLVSLPLPNSKAASYLTKPLQLEGQHLPDCAIAVLDDVSFCMPTEAAIEEAPTVDSTPSPHDVQCDLAPDVDSACRTAYDVARLRKQLVEIKDQRCLDLYLPCCTQAARESVPDGSSSGCEAAMQGVSLCGDNAFPSCPVGPPVGWTDDELFEKQAVNGRRGAAVVHGVSFVVGSTDSLGSVGYFADWW